MPDKLPLATKVLTCGILVCLCAGFESAVGLIYWDAAKHEVLTQGQIVRIREAKDTTYIYDFLINGVKVEDDSDICATPLTPDGCRVGGHVRVYYAYEPFNNSRLEDFSAAARRKFKWGGWLALAGMVLIGVSPALRVSGSDRESSEAAS